MAKSGTFLSDGSDTAPHARSRTAAAASWKAIAFTALISVAATLLLQPYFASIDFNGFRTTARQIDTHCRPPVPTHVLHSVLSPTNPVLVRALRRVDASARKAFSSRANRIDGLALAVVTPDGAVYEGAFGALKANETDSARRGLVDKNSIFRIASVSKLFTVLEMLILRERGALQLSDPVHEYFPNFTYSLASHSGGPITLRHLASHLAGITREFPNANITSWPRALDKGQPLPFPSPEQLVEGLSGRPLVVPPELYPVYSNAGVSLLAQALVVANARHEQANGAAEDQIPTTYEQLVKRDVFRKLHLYGSEFVVTPEIKDLVAVSSHESWQVDLDFRAIAGSGGQLSSMADCIKLAQTLLNPERSEALLPPHVVREWLRPLHVWPDGVSSVGLIWEIENIPGVKGRPVSIYQKGGSLDAFRSYFALNAEYGYGVVMLLTGTPENADQIAMDVVRTVQPAVERALARELRRLYGGLWRSADGRSTVFLDVEANSGEMWARRITLNGTDILSLTQSKRKKRATDRVPIWTTGRENEFRFIYGSPEARWPTCTHSWVTMDAAYAQGHPYDLVYFEGDSMHIPSAEIVLARR